MQSRQSSLNLIASRTSTDEFELLVLGDTSPLGGSNWTVVKDKATGTWFLQLQYPCKSSTYWVRSCRFKCQSISVRHSKILQLCISLSWSIAGAVEIDWSANKMHNLKIVSYPAGLVSKQNQYIIQKYTKLLCWWECWLEASLRSIEPFELPENVAHRPSVLRQEVQLLGQRAAQSKITVGFL